MKADSLISKIMGGLLDQVILNFLFMICCIGVVTIPASVSALYAVELAIHRGEEPGVFSAFLRALRGNFLQPLGIAGVLLAAVAPACLILVLDVLLRWNLSGFWDWILIAWIIYVYAVGIWAMNLSARYRNTLRKTLQNAMILCVSVLPCTLIVLGIRCVFYALYAMMPGEFLSIYTGIMVFFSAATTARLTVIPISRVLKRLTPEEKEDENN